MHKVIQKPDGSLVEVVQEQQLQVQPQQQASEQQPQSTETNPAFRFIESMANVPDKYMGGSDGMASEERKFNETLAREKKQLDDFAHL